jgi:hypothetical protein
MVFTTLEDATRYSFSVSVKIAWFQTSKIPTPSKHDTPVLQ